VAQTLKAFADDAPEQPSIHLELSSTLTSPFTCGFRILNWRGAHAIQQPPDTIADRADKIVCRNAAMTTIATVTRIIPSCGIQIPQHVSAIKFYHKLEIELMSNRSSLVFAAIGAVALLATPALAQPRHHKGNHSAEASSVQNPAQGGAKGAYASSPRTSVQRDPTMYLIDHDIPVKDKTSPSMN
jgi:hypothetical protein